VLTEKGSELSQAVRKAEVNEREANKLKHKLEEIRKQQQQEKQGKPDFKEQKHPLKNLYSNNQNMQDFTNASRRIDDLKAAGDSSNPELDSIYDEVDNEVKKSTVEYKGNKPKLDNLYDNLYIIIYYNMEKKRNSKKEKYSNNEKLHNLLDTENTTTTIYSLN
jgi:phage shock protein A